MKLQNIERQTLLNYGKPVIAEWRYRENMFQKIKDLQHPISLVHPPLVLVANVSRVEPSVLVNGLIRHGLVV